MLSIFNMTRAIIAHVIAKHKNQNNKETSEKFLVRDLIFITTHNF